MSDNQHASLDAPFTDRPQAQPSVLIRRRRPSPTPLAALPAPSDPARPYSMTAGPTRKRYQLAIEALVSTSADEDRLHGLPPEHQRICLLCREVKSIAEISAFLGIPLGVTRILIADLAEAGLVTVHQSGDGEAAGGPPDATLLEKVLSGLRKLPGTDVQGPRDPERLQEKSTADPEQWLADSYKALVAGVGNVVDVEAGLREVLLQAHHDDAVDGLGDVLDADAGLREALGGEFAPDN